MGLPGGAASKVHATAPERSEPGLSGSRYYCRRASAREPASRIISRGSTSKCTGSEEGLHTGTREQMNGEVLNREQVPYDGWGEGDQGEDPGLGTVNTQTMVLDEKLKW